MAQFFGLISELSDFTVQISFEELATLLLFDENEIYYNTILLYNLGGATI